MALTVNTNTTSLGVQKNLNRASDALATSMTRLSSGLKINSAKDDAAGLQIATRMTSQIRGQTMAIKNANDGISIAQTAEGAMQEQTNMLQRMRELALQARNDSNSFKDRDALNGEFQAMLKEINRVSASTELNGKKLLSGAAGTMTFQVGSNGGSDNQINITLSAAMDSSTGGVLSALGTSGASTIAMSADDAAAASSYDAQFQNVITAIDDALQGINTTRADLGAAQNRLTSTINNLQNVNENAEAARGRVQDTDFAAETAQLTKQQTLQQASTSVLAQANQLPSAVLKLLG
ncbi:flagellin domain-containing protein [Pseudomonas asiatica]|uniref:Flagellin n=1 Tax=Pseudomonas asiatica TaxID=2219225 RepID=A0ABU5L357_9PSED|nr:flagellin domain-containing protein [Pseudomonas asiatica]MDZ5740232.1 flagellin domain-containing protein [Pseudomonas asiatica]MDZ5742550.1 flagellin domain-containing protein [Pseudomonas asiatica]MDZ5750340.1 flagellin domain-containing protein [Pseudomonas asiatica]MDZ5755314.1 flagellin domain-containing protein [Pseudomonas asiatica]